MKILLTNDDGIYAAGIRALAAALKDDHELIMIAPDAQRSAASHSIMIHQNLTAKRVFLNGLEDVEAYAVNGAPADCVILALRALGIRPELVISGINHGSNMGIDVHYSGTVAAAMEGALRGMPAMAVSLRNIDSADFSVPARIAVELIPEFMASGCPLFNINVPDLAYEDIKGIKYTGVSCMAHMNPLEEQRDESGRTHYCWPERIEYPADMDEDCDERWMRDGYVTVTPLLLNYTDRTALERLRG